jgi:hypothetical protein
VRLPRKKREKPSEDDHGRPQRTPRSKIPATAHQGVIQVQVPPRKWARNESVSQAARWQPAECVLGFRLEAEDETAVTPDRPLIAPRAESEGSRPKRPSSRGALGRLDFAGGIGERDTSPGVAEISVTGSFPPGFRRRYSRRFG